MVKSMAQCLIAQISDLHISANGQTIYDQVDSLSNLKKVVSRLNAFSPSIDVVLISGDLAHDASQSAYQVMFKVLAELEMPFYVVPGNHDDRDYLRQAVIESSGMCFQTEGLNWSCNDYPIHLIGLDSLIDGQDGGHLSSQSLAFLSDQLSAFPDKPAMVMLHHPPIDSGIEFMDQIKLDNACELESIIRAHKQVLRVSCGHLHRSLQTQFAGTLLSVCPSTSHQMKLVLDKTGASFIVEQSAQFLLHHYACGQLNTHQMPVDDAFSKL